MMVTETARDIRDRIGEAVRRYVYGLVRPLWHDLPEEHREAWRREGDVLVRILGSVGIEPRIAP